MTAASSFPASLKGGTGTCGSTVPTSFNAHPCGKGEPSERKRSGAGAAGVQVRCSITRLHYPCSDTTPCTLLLPHAVSSLMILRDRGDVSDSQQGIKTMPPSTSATLMVVLATHPSEGLVRDVDGERHGDVTVPPCGHATASCTSGQSTQLICLLNLRARMVRANRFACAAIGGKVIKVHHHNLNGMLVQRWS